MRADLLSGRPCRLAVFPAGSEDVASARLRAFPLLGLLDRASVRSAAGTSWIPAERPDIAWFQKQLTPRRLRLAARLKAAGCHIVYDCDESGSELLYWASPDLAGALLRLADLVTTDTPERARLLRELDPACRPRVLENQLDFGESLSAAGAAATADGAALRVLWFGYGSNLALLSPYRDVIGSAEGIRWVFCGPGRSEVRRALGPIAAEVRTWSRHGFPDILRSCHVSLLSHFGTRHHAAKSAHKMVTSFCHGVPALVSATPDYSRVAALAGVQHDVVYASPEQLQLLLQRMKSAAVRRACVARARSALLARYGPGTFAAAAASLLQHLIASPTAARHVAH